MTTLRQRLKEATQPLHDQVESTALMSRLMRDDLSLGDYAGTLLKLHALYAPLERELARVANLDRALPDLSRRFKADALARDLDALRASPDGARALAEARLIEPPRVTPIEDVPAALGTLYVLEGSTMGGRLIATKLKTRPFVSPASLSFFQHYGAEGGVFWQRFLTALTGVSAADFAAAEEAARRTFGYFIDLAKA